MFGFGLEQEIGQVSGFFSCSLQATLCFVLLFVSRFDNLCDVFIPSSAV
jgi:hypothetical protein